MNDIDVNAIDERSHNLALGKMVCRYVLAALVALGVCAVTCNTPPPGEKGWEYWKGRAQECAAERKSEAK